MSFLHHWFGNRRPDRKAALLPLYQAVVAKAREPHWYQQGGVPDSVDGRFEMITAILGLLELRLEGETDQAQNLVFLTEIFVDDMDGQLREFGIGDMIVGKHIGRIMAAFGGRMGAYRESIGNIDDLEAALIRNLYRGENPGKLECAHVGKAMIAVKTALDEQDADAILRAELAW
jgi:cytochrome b pre-mRNA-processing protein 3